MRARAAAARASISFRRDPAACLTADVFSCETRTQAAVRSLYVSFRSRLGWEMPAGERPRRVDAVRSMLCLIIAGLQCVSASEGCVHSGKSLDFQICSSIYPPFQMLTHKTCAFFQHSFYVFLCFFFVDSRKSREQEHLWANWELWDHLSHLAASFQAQEVCQQGGERSTHTVSSGDQQNRHFIQIDSEKILIIQLLCVFYVLIIIFLTAPSRDPGCGHCRESESHLTSEEKWVSPLKMHYKFSFSHYK